LQSKKPTLNENEIRDLFSGWEVILTINKEFLTNLTQRYTSSDSILVGDLFQSLSTSVRLYAPFINNFDVALQAFNDLCFKNKKFKDFCYEASRNPECNKLDLPSYFIMPVQRVPRYMLLITNLLQHTPESHQDFIPLSSALEEFKNVAILLNEGKRKAEAISKVFVIYKSLENYPDNLILKGRIYIKEGTLIELTKKGKRCVYIYLFNNLMLLCKQITRHKYKFIKNIPLSNLKLTTPTPNEEVFLLQMQQEEKGIDILLETNAESERVSWLNAIQKQISYVAQTN